MRVVCVFGTRLEAIKMAPVIKQLYCYTDRIVPHVWVTAQHCQMLDQALGLFGIQPDLGLDIMQEGQTPLRKSRPSPCNV
jgi:UDP-N-acetylglucosamine 2-epimerase (non-hydrolysing)